MTTRAAKRKGSVRALEAARRARALQAEIESVVSVPEFRDFALDSIEPDAFDYIDGGAWDEVTLGENIKGILTAEDARIAAGHGVDAIIVSNHGGRQLDRTAAAIDVLEEIAAAVPGTELWVDGGVRRGLDIAIAIALGARGVLVGRPLLWALAAGGEAGVARALAILREEFEIALTLLGAPTPGHLVRDHVAARPVGAWSG